MTRLPHRETSGRDRSNAIDRDRRFLQVHTMRSGSERDIEPVVYDDRRSLPVRAVHQSFHQVRQHARREVAFTHLNDVHARINGVGGDFDEHIEHLRAIRAERQPIRQSTPVGDEADHLRISRRVQRERDAALLTFSPELSRRRKFRLARPVVESRFNEGDDFRHAETEIQHAETRHRTAQVRIPRELAQERHHVEDVVVIPISSPRQNHEQQPDFEETGRVDQLSRALLDRVGELRGDVGARDLLRDA